MAFRPLCINVMPDGDASICRATACLTCFEVPPLLTLVDMIVSLRGLFIHFIVDAICSFFLLQVLCFFFVCFLIFARKVCFFGR